MRSSASTADLYGGLPVCDSASTRHSPHVLCRASGLFLKFFWSGSGATAPVVGATAPVVGATASEEAVARALPVARIVLRHFHASFFFPNGSLALAVRTSGREDLLP